MYKFTVKIYQGKCSHEYDAIAACWFDLWYAATERYFPCTVVVRPFQNA
jgi:hypothetical protein